MKTIQIEKKNEYVVVQLNRGKVNAINHQMVKEIRQVFNEFENDDSVKGAIITGIPHFFTAGLDVIELYSYDRPKMNEFFNDFGGMYIQLAKFSKPFICAITGYSPAGGCVIAITADHRIMAAGEKYTIGLNEVAVNIQISSNLVRGYSYWIGEGKANEYILSGKLLNVDEALTSGLVNEVCDMENVIARAEIKMQQYLQADPEIFKNTKYKLRKDWLESMENDPKIDLEQAISLWWKPEIRNRMKAFVESLQKNKAVS
ncbi:enoyl-CoA hydratase/isomerase family protein [Aquimarina litoralis]|uniref:enoyl-CoA hydratase/isomerase family protein n=1 Tax=Aquimarina litoralis TaxID=584605 RepID=UPI001C576686|nr:enoyl-CoA hydratase/isomerase family protein [Aquimarina litoralis]MBW1296141.1 enoyl-CoA hydratase/isomerase family protein [Aquimarina litoralis]